MTWITDETHPTAYGWLVRLVAAALLAFACAPSFAASEWTGAGPGGDTVVRIVHEDGERDTAEQLLRVLPAAARAATRFGSLPARVVVTVHATNAALAAVAGPGAAPWARGWSRAGAVEIQSPRTWSRGRASDAAMTQLLAHELAHVATFEAIGSGWDRLGIPRWFLEGIACAASGERHSRADDPSLSDAPSRPPGDPRSAYGAAERAFRRLLDRSGEPAVRAILSLLSNGRPFERAFEEVVGTPAGPFLAIGPGA